MNYNDLNFHPYHIFAHLRVRPCAKCAKYVLCENVYVHSIFLSVCSRLMGGPAAPADWQGGLNITYRLGPGFDGARSTHTVRLQVGFSYTLRFKTIEYIYFSFYFTDLQVRFVNS